MKKRSAGALFLAMFLRAVVIILAIVIVAMGAVFVKQYLKNKSNKDVSNEALGRLKDEMNKMKDEVVEASGLLNERSDKIKVLDDKADTLSRDSNTFYRQSKRVRRVELMKKLKLYGGIACAILLLIYIVICIACGDFTFCSSK